MVCFLCEQRLCGNFDYDTGASTRGYIIASDVMIAPPKRCPENHSLPLVYLSPDTSSYQFQAALICGVVDSEMLEFYLQWEKTISARLPIRLLL